MYCEVCGTKLEEQNLEHEGIVPYCPCCKAFRFKKFNVAVSMVVVNSEKNQVLLIEQYGKKRYILVAGYVNCGESAEEACRRELAEEVSLKVQSLIFQKTKYFEKTNTLMINYIAIVENEEVTPNHEVDDYAWFSIEDGKTHIAKGSLAEEFYLMFYEKVMRHEI